jgi:hypothetical protein
VFPNLSRKQSVEPVVFAWTAVGYTVTLVLTLATSLSAILWALWRIGNAIARIRAALAEVEGHTRPLEGAVRPLNTGLAAVAASLARTRDHLAAVEAHLAITTGTRPPGQAGPAAPVASEIPSEGARP